MCVLSCWQFCYIFLLFSIVDVVFLLLLLLLLSPGITIFTCIIMFFSWPDLLTLLVTRREVQLFFSLSFSFIAFCCCCYHMFVCVTLYLCFEHNFQHIRVGLEDQQHWEFEGESDWPEKRRRRITLLTSIKHSYNTLNRSKNIPSGCLPRGGVWVLVFFVLYLIPVMNCDLHKCHLNNYYQETLSLFICYLSQTNSRNINCTKKT